MIKRVTTVHIVLFVAFCILLGCNPVNKERRSGGDSAVENDSLVREYNDLTTEIKMRVDSAIMNMDTNRLVAQMFMPAVYSSNDYWTIEQIRRYARDGIGGIVLLKGDSEGARILADTFRKMSAVPPFISIDAEWGLRMRLADAPIFPANGNIKPEADDQLMYDYGREVARECRVLGINMVLGPVLDVSENNNFLGIRSFGNNPERVADLGVAYGLGLEAGNVIGVAKHFPGHGSVATDSHKRKGRIDKNLHTLDSIDLYPFRCWVENGLSAVMVGHLAVPAIDSHLYPAAVSKVVIGDLLRTDLGFKGLVITDAMNMSGVEGYGSEMAIAAGADIIIAPKDTRKEMDRVKEAIESGSLGIEMIKERVRRILFYKYLIAEEREEGIGSIVLESETSRKLRRELSEK